MLLVRFYLEDNIAIYTNSQPLFFGVGIYLASSLVPIANHNF